MGLQKQYTVKVFQQDGTTFVTNISPEEIKGHPQFTQRINGGFSQLTMTLQGGRFTYDVFSDGTIIKPINIVQVDVIDADNPRGRTLFKGFMSKIEPYLNADGDEGVIVTVLHLTSLLSLSYYQTGGSYTVAHSGDDPETIIRAIVDDFNSDFGGSLLSYTGDSTDPTGTTVDITYSKQKWFDAIKKAAQLAGTGGWWWSVDATGVVYFKAKPATATHTFTIGKDVTFIKASKTTEGIINDVLVEYDGGSVTDSDATSQSTHGTGSTPTSKWTKLINDTELKNSAAATQRAAQVIAENKDPKIQASIVVNNQYDLASIKVGETIKIRNMDKDNTFLNDNMQIATVAYQGDFAILALSNEPVNFAQTLDDFVNDS